MTLMLVSFASFLGYCRQADLVLGFTIQLGAFLNVWMVVPSWVAASVFEVKPWDRWISADFLLDDHSLAT